MKRSITVFTAVALLGVVLWIGCGPKNGGGTKVPDNGGDIVVADDGEVTQEISEKAKEGFEAAVNAFEQHEQAKDWAPAICEDLEKQFREASKKQSSGLVKAIYNVGVVWQKCGEHKKAFEAFDEAEKLDQKQNSGKKSYPAPIIQKGTYKLALYLKDGKLEDVNAAKKYFEEAIEVGGGLHPSLVEAYVNLAMIQRMEAKGDKKKYEEALKNLQRALVIDSKSLDAFLQMAELYRVQAEFEKDDSKLDLATLVISQGQLIEAEKGTVFPALNLTLGLMKVKQGDIIGGLKNFMASYGKDPDLYEAWVNYGSITIGFRGYEDAELAFTKALELKPGNYDGHLNLGVAQRGMEKYEEAEANYKKAIEIDPGRPDAYFNVGLLYQDYRLDMAGDSGYENFVIAVKWYKDFKSKAGTKKEYVDLVAEADKRIKNCENAIELMKEAAAIMASTPAEEPEPPPAATPPAEGGEGGAATPPAEGGEGGAASPAEGGDVAAPPAQG